MALPQEEAITEQDKTQSYAFQAKLASKAVKTNLLADAPPTTYCVYCKLHPKTHLFMVAFDI